MASEDRQFLAFNRGVLSSIGLARIDLERYGWAAAVQKNFMPRVLGSMMLRPGMKFIDYMNITGGIGLTRQIPFIFEEDDTALIEVNENGEMLVRLDDVLLTRPSVATVINNPSFIGTDDDVPPNWSIDDDANCDSFIKDNSLYLRGSGEGRARTYQTLSVAGGDLNVEHGIRVTVNFGPVRMRVGTTVQGDELADTLLEKGVHQLAFTPVLGDITIEFSNDEDYNVIVAECAIFTGDVLLTTPWSTADQLRSLRWDQSADRVYVAADGVPQKVIERRFDGRSWSIVDFTTRDGPFRVQNTSAITLTPSAIQGGYNPGPPVGAVQEYVTLTASDSVFKTEHQGGAFGPGALFRIASAGQNVTDNQGSAVDVFTNPIRVTGTEDAREFGIIIEGTFTATARLQFSFSPDGPWNDQGLTWTVATSTTYKDGQDNQIIYYRLAALGVDWSSGSMTMTLTYTGGSITGIARITDVVSDTVARVEVLRPFGAITPSKDWWEGSWSGFRGYPSAVALHEGRLGWAGEDRIWLSVSDDFESHDDEVEGDSGPINRTIATGAIRVINWMLSMARLIMGTTENSAAVAGQRIDGNNPLSARSTNFEEPLTPFNFNIKTTNSRGVYVDRTRQRLYELVYDIDIQDFKPVDLSIFAPDYNRAGILQIAVQMKPDLRIHCVRADGTVGVLIYDRAENVMAWVEVELGGPGNWMVEDAAVLPGITEDQVYYTVKAFNSVDGEERYLLKWSLEEEAIGGLNNYIADAWIQYDGAPINTMTGINHLAGQTVCVWADGGYAGTGTVTQFGTPGELDLSTLELNGETNDISGSSNVIVGLQYTAQFQSTKMASLEGIGLLEEKKIDKIGFIAENLHYQGLRYGPTFDQLYDMPLVEESQITPADTVWPEYHQGDFAFGGEWKSDSRVCLQAEAPKPCTLLAAIAEFQSLRTSGRR